MPGRVIYLVRSWPRLSQTFVLNEVLAVERRGIELDVFSLVRSDETVVQPQLADVQAPVTYLDERTRRQRLADVAAVARREPRRLAATAWYALGHRGLSAGYATCSTWRCFLHAVSVAADLTRSDATATPATHVHAHFAHDPALVAVFVHRLTGLPYSLTAHARDLYQIPAGNLAARTAAASAVVTCCAVNADYLDETLPVEGRPPIQVVHHGVELDRFVPPVAPVSRPVPVVVSVGRLVEKKGYDDLLRALAEVRATGHALRAEIYGDGPLRGELEQLRDQLGLDADVSFPGEHGRERILSALQGADVFALTPRVTDDGDRDGIPNVLVEAMACGRAVLTTVAGGVSELVSHERNGLLAAPRDVSSIAAGLIRLLEDASLRRRLGAEARRTVEADYDVDHAAATLAGIFRLAPAAETDAVAVGAR
jgi:glycosyltransferase involved in cell wall biosynthesis